MTEILQDKWTTDEFTALVEQTVKFFHDDKIEEKCLNGVKFHRLTPGTLREIRRTGIFIPADDREVWDEHERVPLDQLMEGLQPQGCISFGPSPADPDDDDSIDSYCRLLHYRKLTKVPGSVRMVAPGALYELVNLYAQEKDGAIGITDYFTVNPKTGAIVPCLSTSHSRLGAQERFSGNLDMVKQKFALSTAMQFVDDMRYQWAIKTSNDRGVVSLGAYPEVIKSVLYARELPVTETGRKRPILHLVHAHQRRLRGGIDIDIDAFLRGTRKIEMGGTEFEVTASKHLLETFLSKSPAKSKARYVPPAVQGEAMKVGIIGLQPRQVPSVADRNINASLSFFDGGDYSNARIKSFADKMDHIVLLSGHVPSRVHHLLPSKKTQFVPGNVGISTVIRTLEERYGTMESSTKETRQKAPKVEVVAVDNAATEQQAVGKAEPAVAVKPMVPIDWKAAMLTTASSEYIPVHEVDGRPMIVVGANGRFDHSILEAAQPGDTVRYFRDPEDDVPKTYARFIYVRRVYSARLKRMIEVHIFRNYVDVYVSNAPVKGELGSTFVKMENRFAYQAALENGQRLKKMNPTPQIDVKTEDPPPAVDVGPKVKPGTLIRRAASDAPEGVLTKPEEAKVGAELPLTKTASEAAREAAAADRKDRRVPNHLELQFWQNATLAALQGGQSVQAATASASTALAEYYRLAKNGIEI